MKKENTSPDFVEIEHEYLKKWEDMHLFDKLVEKNKNSKNRFKFLDGPATANNRLGVHHFWGRIIKDMAIRYHTMKGYSCGYQNGFDSQGMWVEVNTEKALGLNGKPEILNYGMDKFTEKCIERVNHYANEITSQSKRMGQCMDWNNSYFTNTDENITAIWAFLKKCAEKGWIVKKYRPIAWCPRCGTSLSEHELSGAYGDVTHTAIFFKVPVKNADFKMVGWTTTPWTLTANCALAVNPELTYVKVLYNGEKLCFGKDSLKILKGEAEIIEEFKGDKLVGLEYETMFPELEMQQFTHKIYAWDQVLAGEGACVVHIAPGCGVEDFELGEKEGIPSICPINDQGVMLDNCGFIAGKKTTDVVDDVVNRLKQDNKLLYAHKYKHSYAHCWRCKTDIVYKLISTWYIKMDEIRPLLLKAIDDVEFQPSYAKKRMQDWLNNMGDWNISRSRFYGLPLPFYVCPKCGKVHIIGSVEELKAKAVNPEEFRNIPHLHRPYIDAIQIKCDNCGETVSRIAEVGDCWLDAGITPFSTKKYFTDKEYFKNNFPSDFVCEMIEQIKLWFYSTLVMSVVLESKAPYKKIVTYQYVKDEKGEEFHKSGGNCLEADIVADETSAEAIRYLFAGANPVNDMRFGYGLTDEAKKKILSFWNIYVFFNTYACIDNPKLDGYKVDTNSLCMMDKWLLEKTANFAGDADKNYAEDKSYNIIKDFETLVDDISNFYIRANRKRFWDGENAKDQLNAYYCLYTAIKTIIKVMAPILPFVTDRIWNSLVLEIEKNETLSIHLSSFPDKFTYGYKNLVDEIAKSREIIYVAQKLRNEHKIKIKQPLNTLYLKLEKDYEKVAINMKDVILDELNIKNMELIKEDGMFNTKKLVLNFRKAGAVLKGEVNKYKQALENASETEMAEYVESFENGKNVKIAGLNETSFDLFELKNMPKEEYAIDVLNNNVIAIDITLNKELILEGALREVIRQIQLSRKEAGFKIEDRIYLNLETTNEEMQNMFKQNLKQIQDSTLATHFGKIATPEYRTEFEVNDSKITLSISRVNK